MSIERYDCNSEMYHSHYGSFVRFDDHEAELAALRAELEVFREREAATAQGVRWLENESKRIERRAEKAEAELTALRERVARLVGAIEPAAKVHINRTGGNVGIAWRAIGIDGSLPALADGEILYVLRTALGER